jgi:hypothetical protein
MSSPLDPFRAPTSSSQNLHCDHKDYKEGRFSSQKTKSGTTMNILEAAKKETPQCVGLLTEEDVILLTHLY